MYHKLVPFLFYNFVHCLSFSDNFGECSRKALRPMPGCQIKSRIWLIDLWDRITEKHMMCSHATSPRMQAAAKNQDTFK